MNVRNNEKYLAQEILCEIVDKNLISILWRDHRAINLLKMCTKVGISYIRYVSLAECFSCA